MNSLYISRHTQRTSWSLTSITRKSCLGSMVGHQGSETRLS